MYIWQELRVGFLVLMGACISTKVLAHTDDVNASKQTLIKQDESQIIKDKTNPKLAVQDCLVDYCDVVIANLAQMGYQVQVIDNGNYQGQKVLDVLALKHGGIYQVIMTYPSLKILRIKKQN